MKSANLPSKRKRVFWIVSGIFNLDCCLFEQNSADEASALWLEPQLFLICLMLRRQSMGCRNIKHFVGTGPSNVCLFGLHTAEPQI